ncbi:MAG: large subunit ribosomal protein L32 [Ancylomarina sp.]|jgi:large subunit ribosomal protein L32|tara:strand:- start:7912 stop:8097 length:186 start_codon:yes stop_codon:yes gene_type:complete
MAHPKHRTSKQRKGKRRTHIKATPATLASCSNCGATAKYHTVCPECGYYRGKLAIEKEVTA